MIAHVALVCVHDDDPSARFDHTHQFSGLHRFWQVLEAALATAGVKCVVGIANWQPYMGRWSGERPLFRSA